MISELGSYFLNFTNNEVFINFEILPFEYGLSGAYFYDSYSLTSYAPELSKLTTWYYYDRRLIVHPFKNLFGWMIYNSWDYFYSGIISDIIWQITGDVPSKLTRLERTFLWTFSIPFTYGARSSTYYEFYAPSTMISDDYYLCLLAENFLHFQRFHNFFYKRSTGNNINLFQFGKDLYNPFYFWSFWINSSWYHLPMLNTLKAIFYCIYYYFTGWVTTPFFVMWEIFTLKNYLLASLPTALCLIVNCCLVFCCFQYVHYLIAFYLIPVGVTCWFFIVLKVKSIYVGIFEPLIFIFEPVYEKMYYRWNGFIVNRVLNFIWMGFIFSILLTGTFIKIFLRLFKTFFIMVISQTAFFSKYSFERNGYIYYPYYFWSIWVYRSIWFSDFENYQHSNHAHFIICRSFVSYLLQRLYFNSVYYFLLIRNNIHYGFYCYFGDFYYIYYSLIYKLLIFLKLISKKWVAYILWNILVFVRREAFFFSHTDFWMRSSDNFFREYLFKEEEWGYALPPFSSFIVTLFQSMRSVYPTMYYCPTPNKIKIKLHLLNGINWIFFFFILILFAIVKFMLFILTVVMRFNKHYFILISYFLMLKVALLKIILFWEHWNLFMILKTVMQFFGMLIFFFFSYLFFFCRSILVSIYKLFSFILKFFGISLHFGSKIGGISGSFFIYTIYFILMFICSAWIFLFSSIFVILRFIIRRRFLLFLLVFLFVIGWVDSVGIIYLWTKFLSLSIINVFTFYITPYSEEVGIWTFVRAFKEWKLFQTLYINQIVLHNQRLFFWIEEQKFPPIFRLARFLWDPWLWCRFQYQHYVISVYNAMDRKQLAMLAAIHHVPYYKEYLVLAVIKFILFEFSTWWFYFSFYEIYAFFLPRFIYNFLAQYIVNLLYVISSLWHFSIVVIKEIVIWVERFLQYLSYYWYISESFGYLKQTITGQSIIFYLKLLLVGFDDIQQYKQYKHKPWYLYSPAFDYLFSLTFRFIGYFSSERWTVDIRALSRYVAFVCRLFIIKFGGDPILYEYIDYYKIWLNLSWGTYVSDSTRTLTTRGFGSLFYSIWLIKSYFVDWVISFFHIKPYVTLYHNKLNYSKTLEFDRAYMYYNPQYAKRLFFFEQDRGGISYLKTFTLSKTWHRRTSNYFKFRIYMNALYFFILNRQYLNKATMMASYTSRSFSDLMWFSLVLWSIFIVFYSCFSQTFREIFGYHPICNSISHEWREFRLTSLSNNMWLFDFDNNPENDLADVLRKFIKNGTINLQNVCASYGGINQLLKSKEFIVAKDKIGIEAFKGYFVASNYNDFFQILRDEFISFNIFLAYGYSRSYRDYLKRIVLDLPEEFEPIDGMYLGGQDYFLFYKESVTLCSQYFDGLEKTFLSCFNSPLPHWALHKNPGVDFGLVTSAISKGTSIQLSITDEDPNLTCYSFYWLVCCIVYFAGEIVLLNGWTTRYVWQEFLFYWFTWFINLFGFVPYKFFVAQIHGYFLSNHYQTSRMRDYTMFRAWDTTKKLKRMYFLVPGIHEWLAAFVPREKLYIAKLTVLKSLLFLKELPQLLLFQIVLLGFVFSFVMIILRLIIIIIFKPSFSKKRFVYPFSFSSEKFTSLHLFFQWRTMIKKIIWKHGVNRKI